LISRFEKGAKMNDNILTDTIRRIRESGRPALCGYFLTGYRTPGTFYEAVRMAKKLDIVEFGIPSTDPYLDGSLIGSAHNTVVRKRGLQTETALALIGGLKNIVQPRFVMTYANEARSLKGFFRLCVEHQIHGVLAPDVPLDEAREMAAYAASLSLTFISFIDSTMPIEEILERARLSELVYLKVSGGVTGSDAKMLERVVPLMKIIKLLKSQYSDILIGAGVGIQRADQVSECAKLGVDMVVVGTVLMEKMNRSFREMTDCIESLHRAALPRSVSRL